jgi:hypothetical protein
MDETPITDADYAVQQSGVFTGIHALPVLMQVAAQQHLSEIAAGDYIGRYMTKFGLSRGGLLKLLPYGEEAAINLVADLIRRA